MLNKYSILILILLFSFGFLSPAKASELSTLQNEAFQRTKDLQANQAAAEAKAKEAAKIKDEIGRVSALIDLTENAILQTENNINITNDEIKDLNKQIDEKKAELDVQKTNIAETIKVLYENGNQNTITILMKSNSITDVIDQSEYLQSVSSQIDDTIAKINQIKADLENKKSEQEKKQAELAGLKKRQEVQRVGLNDQKKEKAVVLASTKSAQAVYEAKVNDSKKALADLNGKISELQKGKGKATGPNVKKGDIIGYEGSSGFSTGPHLHFTVYKDGTAVDPGGYLNNVFSYPMNNYRITQDYGPAGWNSPWYSFHNGIDFASRDGYGAPILATASGTVVFNGCGKYGCGSGFGHYIIIDHNNGFMTLYGHMIN